jgi:hypothetical protein
MKPIFRFEALFNRRELRILSRLDSPARVQAFLADLTYSADDFYRCPRRVLKDREAHCFDGALFGAAALRRLGYPPLVLEMHAKHDDCHLIALFRQHGCWGAVAKSNFAGLRFREPVYRTLRELVMSYFESFYNVEREKTLRSYTRPLNLGAFDKLDWMRSDEHLEKIGRRLDEVRAIPLVTPQMVAGLSRVDTRSYKAGLLGVNRAGLWRPPRESK